MIKYLPYEEKYQDQMYDVFNELTKEEVFFKKLTKEEFSDKLFKNPNFKKEGTFLALEGDKLVGFASGKKKILIKKIPMLQDIFTHLLFAKNTAAKELVVNYMIC